MNSDTIKTIHEEEESEPWDSWDPMSEDYQSTKNTLQLNPDEEPECDVTGKMIDIDIVGKKVCDHYIRYGSCADGKFCDRLHVTPKARDKLWTIAQQYNLNKTRTYLTYNNLPHNEITINPQAMLLISVSHVKSPSDFVFIAPYEQMDFSNLNEDEIEFYIQHVHQTSPYKTKLQKGHEQLAALFDHNYRLDDVNDDIYLSQIVACKLDNGRFCRAMVVELDDFMNEKFDYKLFLIDVGIVVERPREHIYNIRASCLSEPPLAISGRLNLKPAKGQVSWSDDLLKKFKDKLQSKKYLLCSINNYIYQDRIFTVDLFDIWSKASLTDRMVMGGVAELCESLDRKAAIKWDDF